MRELNTEPMRKYCTPVLNKSMCYINSSRHILNIRHCVYVTVNGSSKYLLDPLYVLFSNILKDQVIFRIVKNGGSRKIMFT